MKNKIYKHLIYHVHKNIGATRDVVESIFMAGDHEVPSNTQLEGWRAADTNKRYLPILDDALYCFILGISRLSENDVRYRKILRGALDTAASQNIDLILFEKIVEGSARR